MAKKTLWSTMGGMRLDWVVDPALMMKDAGFEPDPWQARVLRSKSDRVMLLCPRQAGKSETVAHRVLHHALTMPRSLSVIISRSQDQSDILFDKITASFDRLGKPVRDTKRLSDRMKLMNGSSIVSLANNPETVRGHSGATLLVLDEASRIGRAMVTAVIPMILASRGTVMLLSTPNGPTGYFYEKWTDDEDKRWEKISVTAAEVSRYNPDVLAQVEKDLGPLMADQELRCLFVQDSAQCFSTSSVNRAFESDIEAIQGF